MFKSWVGANTLTYQAEKFNGNECSLILNYNRYYFYTQVKLCSFNFIHFFFKNNFIPVFATNTIFWWRGLTHQRIAYKYSHCVCLCQLFSIMTNAKISMDQSKFTGGKRPLNLGQGRPDGNIWIWSVFDSVDTKVQQLVCPTWKGTASLDHQWSSLQPGWLTPKNINWVEGGSFKPLKT